MTGLVFTGQMDVLCTRDHRHLRSCGHQGALSELGKDEFFTFSICLQNHGDRGFSWEQACVRVDGGEAWYWAGGTLPARTQCTLSIFYCNMANCMTPGTHTVVWYFDGRAVLQDRFTITRNAAQRSVFRFLTREEIDRHQRGNTRRSPYIAAHLSIPRDTRYTQYQIDFRATHLPRGTYCCLGSWAMDHSGLNEQFPHAREHKSWINAYAGFQKIATGRTVSIMSFWDVFCTNAQGRETTIQAKILYPKSVIDGGRFWGEGTGARCCAYCDWAPDHWYRMHLKCVAADGTTFVEQWLQDLETGERRLLCVYDICIANSAFKGTMCVFLENFLPETAGEVRALEVCRPRYLDERTNRWHPVTQVYVTAQGGMPAYEGSYDFGVDQGRLWMITSGVGGDWFRNGKGKQGATFALPED